MTAVTPRPPPRRPRRGSPGRRPGDSQYFRSGERFRQQYKDAGLQRRIDAVDGWVSLFEQGGQFGQKADFHSRSFAANKASKQIRDQLNEGQSVIAEFYDYNKDTGDYDSIVIRGLDDKPAEQNVDPDYAMLIRRGDSGQCSTAPNEKGQQLFFVDTSPYSDGNLFAIGGGRTPQGPGPTGRPGRINEGVGGGRQLPANNNLDRFNGRSQSGGHSSGGTTSSGGLDGIDRRTVA